MRIEQAQLGVRRSQTCSQSAKQLDQPCHTSRRLGVTDVRLDARHWQRPGDRCPRLKYCSSKRGDLDWITQRGARSMRFIQCKSVDCNTRINTSGGEQALLCLPAGRCQTR